MVLKKLENIVYKRINKTFLPLVILGTFIVAYDMYKNPKSWNELEQSYVNTKHYMLDGGLFQDLQRATEISKKFNKKELYEKLLSSADQNNNHILTLDEQIDCNSRLGIKPIIYFESQRNIIPSEQELNINQIIKALKTYETN